MAVAPRSGGQP